MNCSKCEWADNTMSDVLFCPFPRCAKKKYEFKDRLNKIIKEETERVDSLNSLKDQVEIMKSLERIRAAKVLIKDC